MDEHHEIFSLFRGASLRVHGNEIILSVVCIHLRGNLLFPWTGLLTMVGEGFFRGLFPTRWRVRNFSNSSSHLAVPCTFLTRGWIWNEPMTEETTYFSAKLATATWASFFSLFLGGPRYECRGNFRKFSAFNQTEYLSTRS